MKFKPLKKIKLCTDEKDHRALLEKKNSFEMLSIKKNLILFPPQ